MRAVVTLMLDPATDAAVRQLWARIAVGGFNVAYHGEALTQRHRPHVSLGGYEVTDVEPFCQAVGAWARRQKPLAIRLHHVGVFPELGVVFLAPRVTRALLDLHDGMLAHLATAGYPEPRSEHARQDQWTPHCTLVPTEAADKVPAIVAACLENWQPLVGTAGGVGVLLPPATVDHCQFRFELTGV